MKNRRGFSLTELLVVISTVSAVVAVSMPALMTARSQAKAVVCRSNVRQLVLANIGYANDNDGFCVPAAQDEWNLIGPFQGGYYRWHGKREAAGEPFESAKGPLADYLFDGKVKECPARAEFTKDQPGDINFELGCGGYGYNKTYIGSRLTKTGMSLRQRCAETPRMAEIKKPDATLMFADTAFYQEGIQGGRYLIEYSFAEPPYLVISGRIYSNMFAMPSIHFRHRGWANVGWSDGHIEARRMADMTGRPGFDAASASVNIGWFEPVDNTLFDLE